MRRASGSSLILPHNIHNSVLWGLSGKKLPEKFSSFRIRKNSENICNKEAGPQSLARASSTREPQTRKMINTYQSSIQIGSGLGSIIQRQTFEVYA